MHVKIDQNDSFILSFVTDYRLVLIPFFDERVFFMTSKYTDFIIK